MTQITYIPPLHLLEDLEKAFEIKKYNHQEFVFFKNGYYFMRNTMPFFVVLDEMGYYVKGSMPLCPPTDAEVLQTSMQSVSLTLICGNEVFDYVKNSHQSIVMDVNKIDEQIKKIEQKPSIIQTPEFLLWLKLYENIKNKANFNDTLSLLQTYFSYELKLGSFIPKPISTFLAPYEIALHFSNWDVINYYLNHFSQTDLLKATNHYLLFHKDKTKQLFNMDFHLMCHDLKKYNLIDFYQHIQCFSMPDDKKMQILSLYEKNNLEIQLSDRNLSKIQKI